ncbi:MAG: hypothetical protein ABIG39_07945 [Candidatus Micrarchaeota archaeon]
MEATTGILLLMTGLVFLMFFGLIIFALKKTLKLAFRIIINSILGLAAIFFLSFIGVNVPIILPVILVVAIFGLAGLGMILIFMFFGIL